MESVFLTITFNLLATKLVSSVNGHLEIDKFYLSNGTVRSGYILKVSDSKAVYHLEVQQISANLVVINC